MPNPSRETEQAIAIALAEAQHQRSSILSTPHLFIALTKLDGATAAALRAGGHDPKKVRDGLRIALGRGEAPPGSEPQLTARAAASLRQAKALAAEEGTAEVEERHLLAAILDDDKSSFTLRALRGLGVDVKTLRVGLTSATPILDRVGRDLTALAQAGELDPLIGRKQELRQLVRTLVRKKKNNPVLVGLAGVGKTAIAEGLAVRIAAGRIPDELKDTRLVELPTAGLVAGTTYRGQFEERLLGLVDEVKRAGDVILFIDEIHTILRAGAVEGGSLDAGNILKPALARGDLRVIGATTTDEYRQYIAQDAALERRFQPVWVGEPSLEEALEILRGVKGRYEAHHGVLIAEDALEAAVQLSVGWMPERHLPDKALDLLDEACARARIPTISAPADLSAGLVVTAHTIAEVLSVWVGVPAEGLLEGD
ncbi:MAG: ATP-dependent Clp protease ATP-binding subunit [Chloroflexi bacterium]|nr:ATP-dependent Clp protease ATP-binding subunit [Chloroflexota bacterium]